jgi:hypothetical protein
MEFWGGLPDDWSTHPSRPSATLSKRGGKGNGTFFFLLGGEENINPFPLPCWERNLRPLSLLGEKDDLVPPPLLGKKMMTFFLPPLLGRVGEGSFE